MKLSASVQTSRLFSSSIQHAFIISLRDGGTTSGLSSLESESISLPLAKPTFACTMRPCGKVFHYLPLIDQLWKSVHICVHCHPIKEGEVFLLCHLDRLCGGLRHFFWWTQFMLTTSPSNLNGLLLVFALPFFPRHGGGRDCPDWSQDDSDAQKKSFPCDSYLLRLIVANWLWLAMIGEWKFSLFPNLILHNHAKRLCSIRYAIKVDLDRNQLRRCPKPLHYSHFNCTSFIVSDLYILPMICTHGCLFGDSDLNHWPYSFVVSSLSIIKRYWARRNYGDCTKVRGRTVISNEELHFYTANQELAPCHTTG